MTLLFDLLVILFLLSVAFFCVHWGVERWGMCTRGWYVFPWARRWIRLVAIWAILLGIYNLIYGLMKVWFTIEGYLI